MNRYALLNRNTAIRGLALSNRIVFPPFVTGYSSNDGMVTDRQVKFYKEIAAGGPGLVIVGATAVSPDGTGWMGNTRIDNDNAISGLKNLFDAIKAEGAAAGIQLYHCGVSTNTERTGGRPLVAPSAVPYPDGSGTAVALTREDIDILEEAFAGSAERAFEAGADLVEIHCAHGYLIDQFLSPLSNRRTDEYGGSLENRARFALNIIEKTRRAVGPDNIVGVRIGADEFAEGGYGLDESGIFSRWMAQKGADFIHVSGGMNQKGLEAMNKGVFVQMAAEIKKGVDVPVICVGNIKNLARAEEIIASGAADLVAMGRALVADPGLIRKSFSGNEDQIVDCVDCLECILSIGNDSGNGMTCCQNPNLP
ncbi:MAG: NADH:flavin oxidoreductase [Desulfobacterales bacterium]